MIAFYTFSFIPECIPRTMAGVNGCVVDTSTSAWLAKECSGVVEGVFGAWNALWPIKEWSISRAVCAPVCNGIVYLVIRATLAFQIGQIEISRQVALDAWEAIVEWRKSRAFAFGSNLVVGSIGGTSLAVCYCLVEVRIIRTCRAWCAIGDRGFRWARQTSTHSRVEYAILRAW